jgi:excisionase family DNA binding protein
LFEQVSLADSGRLLRVNNVVRRLGVPERTIRHWARTGRLPASKRGPKIWVFREVDVVAFMSERDGGRAA